MPTTQALQPRAGGAFRQAALVPAGWRALAWALIAAIFALATFLVLAVVVPAHTLVRTAAQAQTPSDVVFDPTQYELGVYALESLPDGTGYRWTNGHATLTFPYASNTGEIATVDVRLAGAWAPGQQPAHGLVRVNGHEAATFIAGRDFQDVVAEVDTRLYPGPYLNSSDVQVDVESDALPLKGDSRVLGVALERVALTTHSSFDSLLLTGLLWAAAVGAVALVASRFGPIWAALYACSSLVTVVALQLTYTPRAIPPAVEALLAALCVAIGAAVVPKSRPLVGLALVAVLLWLVVAGRVYGDWQMDDAYISYRYAWNLLQGNGLVYNAGEVVEGYTNFLWTVLATATLWAGLPPVNVMLAANIGFGIGTVVLTWRIAARMLSGRFAVALLAVVLLAIDGALVTYGARGSGMETIAFTFFSLLAIDCLWPETQSGMRSRAWAGIALAAAILTRPEGFLVAATLLGVRAWQDRALGLSWARLLAASLLPLAAFAVPYEIWRISYYGWPLPNTFYAKTGMSAALLERGWDYLRVFLGERWLLLAGATIGVFSALFSRAARTGVKQSLTALLIVLSLYVVWAGGDYFPGWRFLLPVLVPMVLLGVDGHRALAARLSAAGALRPAVTGLLAIAACYYAFTALELQSPDSVLAQETRLHADYVSFWGSAGLWLRDNTPPGALTAAKGAGAIAFYSERPVIDMYGLSDIHIAHLSTQEMGSGKAGHEKADPSYVLDRKPVYIFGQWANHFEPVQDRLHDEYYTMTARSPTGAMMEWLVRK